GARTLGHRLVRGVQDQRVPEPERDITSTRAIGTDQIVADEPAEDLPNPGPTTVGQQPLEHVDLELATDHRRGLERPAFDLGETVEPRGQERLDLSRHGEARQVTLNEPTGLPFAEDA